MASYPAGGDPGRRSLKAVYNVVEGVVRCLKNQGELEYQALSLDVPVVDAEVRHPEAAPAVELGLLPAGV